MNNFIYKKHTVIIFMMRSQYNWNRKHWDAYLKVGDEMNLIAKSKLSLKDVRQKTRDYINAMAVLTSPPITDGANK